MKKSQIFVEKDGYVEIEAEYFHVQINAKERTWRIIDKFNHRNVNDADSMEYLTASECSGVKVKTNGHGRVNNELIQSIVVNQ